jgi:hypothetical protein
MKEINTKYMKVIKTLILAGLLLLPGCWWWLRDDDYNSALPYDNQPCELYFSSNNPSSGDKGGYDLYCVNIGDLIENPWYLND